MTLDAPARPAIEAGPRIAVSRGLITVTVAVVALFAASAVIAPTSISRGALLGMLPFAAVLAIAAIGQTLVVQQGGIDLSVAGAISLAVVISTHVADGDDSRLPQALGLGLVVAVVAGIGNGVLIGRLGLNPIVATLGMNALLYAGVLGISGGSPRRTTDLLRSAAGGLTWGIPNSVYVARTTSCCEPLRARVRSPGNTPMFATDGSRSEAVTRRRIVPSGSSRTDSRASSSSGYQARG